MNRVSVVILVVVLVALGLWAATRDRSDDATAPAEPLSAQASLDATESPPAATASDDAVMDDVDDATGSAPASAPRSAPAPFEPVAFLTEAPQQQFDAAEEVLDPDLDYRAVIETDVGTVTVDLFESRAPRTVNNFVFLALHRFYEGVPFHRVIDDFMAQTGDPTGTGRGGPGYAFDDEIDDALVHDRPGLLSMANAGPNTNGSQFFLTMAATPWLDGRHAIFGEIVDGLDVLDALTRVDPQNPSVVAALSDPASRLADQGVSEAANVQGTVEDFLGSELGELPSPGQTFRVVGRRGVFGSADGVPAVGLFPVPDRIERVTITARAKEDQP